MRCRAMARQRPTGCISAARPRWIAGACPAGHAAPRMAVVDSGGTHRIPPGVVDRPSRRRLPVRACRHPAGRVARPCRRTEDKLGIRQSFLASEQRLRRDRGARPLREPVADNTAKPYRHRHRRRQWRQTHLRGVRGRRRGIYVGIGRAAVTGRPILQVERLCKILHASESAAADCIELGTTIGSIGSGNHPDSRRPTSVAHVAPPRPADSGRCCSFRYGCI